MSKRGVLWGLGGLIGVALVTLCLLLVTTTVASAQGSVEPKITNLPTGEASYHALARTPGVEQGLPLIPSLFQLGERPEISLDPLPPRVTEGEALTVTARLNRILPFDVTVHLELDEHRRDWEEPDDLVLLSPATATISAGDLFTTYNISTIDDDIVEGDEYFRANLSLITDVSYIPLFAISPFHAYEFIRDGFTIVDNELTVSLDPLPPQVVEGGSFIVTARLNRVASEWYPVKVLLEKAGSKKGPEDYTSQISGLIATINPGELFTTFTINTIDDDVYEGDESFIVQLSVVKEYRYGVRYGVDVGIGEEYGNFIIVDNEPKVSLDPPPPRVTEGEPLMFTARLNRVVDFPVNVSLRVNIFDDYFMYTATIPAGKLIATFTHRTINDDVYKGDQRVWASLSLVSPGYEFIRVGSHTYELTLVDDEPAVSLDPLPRDVLEGEALAVTARLNRIVNFPVTVRLEVDVFESSYRRDGDVPLYTLSTLTATISPGDLFTTFTVSTIDDGILESRKGVEVRLSVVSPNTVSEFNSVRSFNLLDNESEVSLVPVVRITRTYRTELPYRYDGGLVSEGDTVAITVRLHPIPNLVEDFSVTVRLDIEISPDLGSPDYTLSQLTATISPGDFFTTYTISTIDDDIYEGDKLVRATLSVVSPTIGVGVTPYRGLTAAFREFTIWDDDQDEPRPVLSLDPLPPRVTEGEVLTVTARLDRVVDFPVTVGLECLFTSPSPLFAPCVTSDYMLSHSIATISPGDLFTTLTVSAIVHKDDQPVLLIPKIVSPNLIIGTDWRSESSSGFRTRKSIVGVMTSDRRAFTLVDNEDLPKKPPPTLVIEGVERLEEGNSAIITVRLESAVANNITVSLTDDGSSTVGTDDYTLVPSDKVIMAGDTTAEFTLTALEQSITEIDETLSLIASAPGLRNSVPHVITIPGSTNMVIVDDDMPLVAQWDTDRLRLVENGSAAELRIELSKSTSEDITFTLGVYPVDGQDPAEEGDYTISPQPGSQITIPGGERSVVVTLSALDDADEQHEAFELRIESLDSSVIGVPGVVQIDIIDDDRQSTLPSPSPSPGPDPGPDPDPTPLTVSLGPSEQTVDEGDQIEITARLSETSEDDITVTLTASGGTADTDDHGLTTRESLTIEAGDLTAMFTISTTDDAIYETDETLVLSLSSSAEVERDADESVITISDNDPIPTLSLELDNPSVREGGAVTVRARLSNVSAEAILVALMLESETALPDSDYLPPAELSAEIAAGTTIAEFTIRTVDDSVYEPVETVLLLLSVIEGNVTEGTLAGTLSINDDEPVPTLSVEAPDEIVEGTTELVTIRLSGMTVDPVTIRVSVGDVSEDDYTLSPAEITIEPGQLETTVMLSVADDGRPEISEILVLEVAADGFETVRHRVTIPGPATALIDVDSESESCDQSRSICVGVVSGTYGEPLLLFVEQVSDTTNDIPSPTDSTYLPDIPLWDIEFLLASDPNQVVSELNDRVRVKIKVPHDLVEANGGTPTISIATLHNGSAEWEMMETYYNHDEADDAYHFYVYTTHFSYFALIMLDEVSVDIIEPLVEPSSGSAQPFPLWLLGSIVLAVLVAIVLISLVIRRRKTR